MDQNKIKYSRPVPPFVRYCSAIIPTMFDDSLSYYEALCALNNFIQKNVIEIINNNAAVTEEYIRLTKELKEFVENYFDNLDVQEEINNKLDAMVEDGTLQALFAGYGLEIGEDDKVKVKAGEGITVDENGVSITPFDDFIDVEMQKYHYTNGVTGADTDIYYSVVPSSYKPKIVLADEDNVNARKVPSDFDYKYKPTLMINGGGWDTVTGDAYGVIIIDGVVKQENNLVEGDNVTKTILGIKEDGTLKSYNGTTPAEDVDAQYATRAWYTIIENGLDKTATLTTEQEPRSFIAQDVNGNYLIGVCGGRTYNESGMSKQDIADFLFHDVDGFEPKIAFCLDGGGSSCLMYKGIRQNPLISNENRRCPNYIVFSSETAKSNGVFEAQSVNNAKMIDNIQDKSTAWISKAMLEDMLDDSTKSNTTLSVESAGRVVEGVLVCLNIQFTLAANQSSYSYFFKNLPKYTGLGDTTTRTMYFTGTMLSSSADTDNRVCQFYLQNVEGKGCVLRNRFALPAGKYEINICYLTQP